MIAEFKFITLLALPLGAYDETPGVRVSIVLGGWTTACHRIVERLDGGHELRVNWRYRRPLWGQNCDCWPVLRRYHARSPLPSRVVKALWLE